MKQVTLAALFSFLLFMASCNDTITVEPDEPTEVEFTHGQEADDPADEDDFDHD